MTPVTITPQPMTTTAPSVNGAAPAAGGWQRHLWTVDQYRQLGKAGLFNDVKVMLLDGEIYTMVFPNPPHDVALGLTDAWLRTVFTTGHHVRNQMGFDVGDRNGPEPDLAVVTGSIRDYSRRTPTQAVLIVEVSDTTLHTDLTAKAEKYATAGVPDYWVLDVNARQVHIFRDPAPLAEGLDATAYRSRQTFGENDTVAPLAAPNAVVKVADLLP
jgi:Uma2 family endonuclease